MFRIKLFLFFLLNTFLNRLILLESLSYKTTQFRFSIITMWFIVMVALAAYELMRFSAKQLLSASTEVTGFYMVYKWL